MFPQLIMNSLHCKVSLFLSQKYMSDIKFPFGKEKRFYDSTNPNSFAMAMSQLKH